MKRKLLYLLSIVLLASCSAPKYTYNFGSYDYNAGKRKVAQAEVNNQNSVSALQEEQAAPLDLTASTVEGTTAVTEPGLAQSTQPEGQNLLSAKYNELSKEEKKEFRKEVMHAAKQYAKAARKVEAPGDTDIPLWAYILFAIILPPLAVGLYEGIHGPFWLSILLTILFWLPGVIFAIWRVTKK